MPFQKIRNLGGKLGTAVKETYEANTVGDLLYVFRATAPSFTFTSPRFCIAYNTIRVHGLGVVIELP